MAPNNPRLRILSVGGNSVSAFLSWRLQATNSCDVTLVWKAGYENVAQYGISMKSSIFGNERFKPRSVVRTPEEAAQQSRQPYDYVLLCVKALPDVYDIAAIIEPVVSPQHTCILINTTQTLGVESFLEQRFPTNVVLSLVSGVEIDQLGASEFEHKKCTEIWVGPASRSPTIPISIQSDMAEALAMTLSSGQVDCKVSNNIRQQQYERMVGNIAFFPASVLFETPNHRELLDKVGVRQLVAGIIDELLAVAKAQGCVFPTNFKDKTIEEMSRTTDGNMMYNDFVAKRPMEIETYLGSPMKLAQEVSMTVPRIETLYATLHHLNIVNQQRPAAGPVISPTNGQPPPRMSSAPSRPGMNGASKGPMANGRNSRAPSMTGPPPMMRRGPPHMNGGYGRPMNGYPPISKKPSFENENLGEEFSHLVLYDSLPEGGADDGYGNMNGSSSDIALRERELMLRQKELALREQEYNMRRGGGGRRRPAPSQAGFDEDDDDDDDFFDPMASRGPAVNTDNFDMMSVTSRRNRMNPSQSQLRKNPEMMSMGGARNSRNPFSRSKPNRASTRMMADVPGLHESLMNNPLLGYSSNRYGNVDRGALGAESRANSLTASRLEEVQGGPYNNPGMSRRISQSQGGPRPGNGRPSPPNGYSYGNGMPPNQRPSPTGTRQPAVSRYPPPGQGNGAVPQQLNYDGVSSLYPPKSRPQLRSLTGSASASAGSGDSSSSVPIDSEISAYSSQVSLGPRPPIGVR